MNIFYFLLVFLVSQSASSHNLRNLLLTRDSFKYKQLADAANQTFYQLYNITLDFKDRNFITYNDDTKYYRVVINEFEDRKFSSDDNLIFLKGEGDKFSSFYAPSSLENLNITIFGRRYRLYNELTNIFNIFLGISKKWEYGYGYSIHKNPQETGFKTYVDYTILYLKSDGYINGTFSVIFEDKDDAQEIEDALNKFWNDNEQYIPEDEKYEVKIYAEFAANTIGIWHYIADRREKLVNTAVKTFHQLYDISLDFKDVNVITFNDDNKYFKVLIEEFPKPLDNLEMTFIAIKDGRFVIPDNFPSDLTFKIFGRSYNLKQEYQAIGYLLAASIENGFLTLYTNDINRFQSQIIYRCELWRKNDESRGAFEINFEDKDDKLTIEDSLEKFWNTYKNEIEKDIIVDVKLAAEFVVTTFGIWHHIANRYGKIVKAANFTLYQVFNITIDFNDRYVVEQENEKYFIRVTIDEFPEIPKEYETHFNISSGRVTFPEIPYKPDIKFEVFEKSLDLETEYKSIANMFAAGIHNGVVYLYKKTLDAKITEIRFKCFVNSESGDTYGSFEISLEDKDDKKTIIEALENYWKKLESFAEYIKQKLEYISNFIVEIIGFKNKIIKAFSSSASSFINLKTYLIISLIVIIF